VVGRQRFAPRHHVPTGNPGRMTRSSRPGEPRDTGMVARRVAMMPTVTCASREYIAEHGRPSTLEQLRQHQAVNFLSTATGKHSPFEFVIDGKVHTMMLKGRVSVTSADAYAACCLQGLGFIQAPRLRLERFFQSGKLVEGLPKSPPPPMPVSVMYPHHRQLSPRVRVFIDWVVDRLATA
jgi:LysR family transcriptional regulator, regulator for bpeEF and oprC